MTDKFKQVQFEQDTWKRLLGFMMDENIYLKNRIAEILKDNPDRSLLDDVENFQSRFIVEDEMISILRNDIAHIEKLYAEGETSNGKLIAEINNRLQRLREDIALAEFQFNKLKIEFNTYLTQISTISNS
ncbi:MAG: hypothetical protein JWR61_2468 [Ferruginibacter sp.]|uniref:hypothetical protein n=1 Tax=Ferruginibacter sp. TaxID=1940288 RepID=UPI002659C0F6|nr:hypothetical protein [Ferruginibacter sp.]MDB5277513.1 hypothetical protein [Ferruginibacter sp.]